MRRMEWLAYQVATLTAGQLNAFHEFRGWRADQPGRVSVAWTPHKMKFDGLQMVTERAGANARCDFLCLFTPTDSLCQSWVVATIYHSTNVEAGTWRESLSYIPEARLLVFVKKNDRTVYEAVDEVVDRLASSGPFFLECGAEAGIVSGAGGVKVEPS